MDIKKNQIFYQKMQPFPYKRHSYKCNLVENVLTYISIIVICYNPFIMKKNILSYSIPLFTFLVILLLASCTKEVERLPFQADELFSAEEKAVLAKKLNVEKFNYIRNVTKEEQYKVFLGRVLFYDNQLSADKSVSCESCHKQELAFSDNVAFSRGASGNHTERNSIALASFSSFEGHYGGGEPTDVAANSFFWDGRADKISAQLSETFANPNEMGMKLHELGDRVGSLDYAKVLYDKAFPGQNLTSQNIINAIAAFVNQIESAHAPFDNGLQHQFKVEERFAEFSDAENNGKQLFLNNCASCHGFSLSESFRLKFGNNDHLASNGLDIEYEDNGLGRHTSLVEDNGIFKIPGIRNIALTGPYMHDGRFETLEEVVDFYSENIQAHPNLSEKLKDEDGKPIRMNFNETEKAELVAFLGTLTGTSHMTDINLSTPFN